MAGISWIKLSVNIFDDEKIKLIRSMPEGDSIILIWIQLLCLAGKTNDNGTVYIGQHMYYSDEMLATVCSQPLNTIRLALRTFEEFEMIRLDEDGLISVTNWEKHQNIEGMEKVREQNRIRKRRQREREKQKELPTSHVMSRDSHATDNNKNRLDKNKNRLEKDNNNMPSLEELSENEKLTVDYYYCLVKNNTSKSDMDLVVDAVKTYGWQKVLYTIFYLKKEQKASITSFNYVKTVLETGKEVDNDMMIYFANKEIREFRSRRWTKLF